MTRRSPRRACSSERRPAADTYYVFVPDDYDPNVAYGVLLWLHPVGKGKEKDMEDFRDAWEDFCSGNHLIVVCADHGERAGLAG